MISTAGLKRLKKAADDAGNMPRATVEVADVYSAVRTIEEARVKLERYDDLKRALSLIGEALRDEL